MNNGFDIQAAYAITNHLAVTADMYKRWEKDIYSYYRNTYAFDSSVVKYKRGVVNIGFGYFFPTNRKQTNFINVYAGIGSGRMKVYDNGTYDSSVYNAAYYTNFFQWYIHPAFTFMPYRKAFLSVGTKFIFVNYYDVHTNYNQSQLYAAHLNVLQNRMRSIFQPSVNMQIPVNRSGWMFINWGFALSLFGDSSDGEYVSRFANLSAGLTIDFLKYKKRNKKASSRYQ
ncbi:MAG: hypothetical protein JST09_20075 [Bacteroidetes bacterium]|nr:hypothetical protein [Bacteroidota bacterium]